MGEPGHGDPGQTTAGALGPGVQYVEAYNALVDMYQARYRAMHDAVEREAEVERVIGLPVLAEIARMSTWPADEVQSRATALIERIEEEAAAL